MRRSDHRALFFLCAVLCVALPRTAAAQGRFTSLDAALTVADNGESSVRLELDLVVDWARERELRLGPFIQKPRDVSAVVWTSERRALRPDVEVDAAGAIRLRFDRADALTRGDYRVVVRYHTQLEARRAAGESKARLAWQLPAWESGLTGVQVAIETSEGSEIWPTAEEAGVRSSIERSPNGTLLKWRRIHLPRTFDWDLAFGAPTRWTGPSTAPATATSPPPLAATAMPPTPLGSWPALPLRDGLILFVLAVVVALKRGAGGEPWLAAAPVATAVWLLLCMAVGMWLAPKPTVWLAAAAMLPLGLKRPVSRTARPNLLGSWCSVPCDHHARQVPSTATWLDATTLFGACTWFALGVAAFQSLDEHQAFIAVALLAPLFLSGTRYHRVANFRRKLTAIRQATGALRVPPDLVAAFELLAFTTARGERIEPRVRVHLPHALPGLRRVDIVMADRKCGNAWQQVPRLLVTVRRACSLADRVRARLRGRAPDYSSSSEHSWLLPLTGASFQLLSTTLQSGDTAKPPVHTRPLRKTAPVLERSAA